LQILCVLTYRIDDPDWLSHEAKESGISLEFVSPEVLNLLATIAYARRHGSVLQHLISYPAPPASTFDVLGDGVLRRRTRSWDDFQHCDGTTNEKESEWEMWTSLLQSAWVHTPMPRKQYYGLQMLAEVFKEDPEIRASPILGRFLRAMSERGMVVGVGLFARLFSMRDGEDLEFPQGIVPCTVAQARTFLSYFPLQRVLSQEAENNEPALISVPITQWGLQNQDRLQVMRMLLEQGLDPNRRIIGWIYVVFSERRDPPLHMAAKLGDMAMVELLLEFGAQKDALGGLGDTAAQKARKHGHESVAARIEAN
jgi:Ankyrin repeats (many copies)